MDNDLSIVEFQPRRRLDFETADLVETSESDIGQPFIEGNQTNLIVPLLSIPNDLIPKLGMEFNTEMAAKKYYEAYAKAIGFGTRLSKGHKDKNSEIMLDRIFCCSHERKRPKDKRNVNVKCPCPETRCDCAAMMKISSRQTRKYRVVQFVPEHNHELSTPSNTHLFRSHRQMTVAHKVGVDMARSCGIPPK
ncbi:hypothetical protein ACH5RR_038902 [Cinchona calisaya]|uniref:FAR1 domain-containing protein n=1 Tax=Cinchona calisaya TaxID=153742 RepID=A0ABD2Y049_9GENT